MVTAMSKSVVWWCGVLALGLAGCGGGGGGGGGAELPDPGNPNYKNDIPWPEKVYVRVIRVNNSGSCSQYTLQVSRTPN